MGRAKEYRQRLKYQVASARKKTLESLLAVRFVEELGMSETEARLLGYRTARWIFNQPDVRGPNQVLSDAVPGRDAFARKHKALTKIRLTPYDIEDLDLELEFGLSTMQAGRILRLIEEAYRQDALLCAKQLTVLCNITPTSLRSRLAGLRREGIWAPVAGLSRVDRERGGKLRSSWALTRYLDGEPLAEVRQMAALSREAFRHLWSQFSHLALSILKGGIGQGDPEGDAWAAIVKTVPKKKLLPLLEEPGMPPSPGDRASFMNELVADFALSPVKARALREIAEEIMNSFSLTYNSGDANPGTYCLYGSAPSGDQKPTEKVNGYWYP